MEKRGAFFGPQPEINPRLQEYRDFVYKDLQGNLVLYPSGETGPDGDTFASSLVHFLNQYSNLKDWGIRKNFDIGYGYDFTFFKYVGSFDIVSGKRGLFSDKRPAIASINYNAGNTWRNFPLNLYQSCSDRERELILLWENIRTDYIPPNFPIENAFWLKDIISIRKKTGIGMFNDRPR
jgi:hypothetical protein